MRNMIVCKYELPGQLLACTPFPTIWLLKSRLRMRNSFKSYLFVAIQAGLLLGLVLLPNPGVRPSGQVQLIGRFFEISGIAVLLIAIYDLRRSLTVMPTPIEKGVLQIRGTYRYVRHPMYSAVIMLALGIAVGSGGIYKYVLCGGLMVLFHYKARYEEQLLQAKYPEYADYMKHTPRFLPVSWGKHPPKSTP